MWNLILSLSEYETRPFVRYALTVDFDPINVYCPEFLNYPNTVTGYDSVMKTRILETMGYILTIPKKISSTFLTCICCLNGYENKF